MISLRSYRRFFWLALAGIGLIALVNILTWYLATSKVLSGAPEIGDLARMGYLPAYVADGKPGGTLPPGSKHLEYWQYQGQPVDIVTIGDSFSQGGGWSYYQDYLAESQEMTVLNLSELFWYPDLTDRFDPVVNLLNAGEFDRLRPKYVLIQNVERLADALTADVDWEARERAGEYLEYLAQRQQESRLETPVKKGMFNLGNVKYLYNKPFYYFSHHDYRRRIYKVRLDKDYFSGSRGDALLFHFEDLKWARRYTPAMAEKINANLNELAHRLATRGIGLCFMPAVDKYDLYRQFIAEDLDYPAASLFADLDGLAKDYILINTRSILLDQVRQGELDIFWQDDTHWSWKAGAAIAAAIRLPPVPPIFAGGGGPSPLRTE